MDVPVIKPAAQGRRELPGKQRTSGGGGFPVERGSPVQLGDIVLFIRTGQGAGEYPAIITRIHPDGHCDLVYFRPGISGECEMFVPPEDPAKNQARAWRPRML